MKTAILAACTLLVLPVAVAAQTSTAAGAPAPFTLEQIMSKPFPSVLTADASGADASGKLAWVVNLRGARNVWIAAPPGYRGHAVTRYTEDDGQEIDQLAWLPGGRGLLYVRGGDFEHGLENPNPLTRPELPEQAIWLASPDSATAPRRIAEGNTPVVVPATGGGDRVVFLRKHQVWNVSLAKPDAKAEQLIQIRGRVTAMVLSPDSSALALQVDRGDHILIAVYRFAEKDVRWMNPGVDTDTAPGWSPDSKRLAFVRIATQSGRPRGPVRSVAQPWSIRMVEVAGGTGRDVWRASAGRGSAFHPMVSTAQVMWAAGNRLVFPWERDGWLHLYSIAADGKDGEPALLTPGDFEVEHAALEPGGAAVVFSSNQDDIDRRHLWRVAPAPGSRPAAITSGAGIEWSPAPLGSGGALAYLASGARHPAAAMLRRADGTIVDLAPDSVPAEFPAEAALIEPRPVLISAADGLAIHAQLFLPREDPGTPQRHPAVVFFHGGSRRQMLLGWHYMYYYNNAYAMNQYLASRGYVVLSVNYRSGIGYGLDFREALNYGPAGASEFEDVQGAGLYLRSRTDVDPRRIGLWGGSYGGYLTALGLARASDLYAAGVDMHGVHNWAARGGAASDAQSDAARKAFESSPMASVKTWRSPVLLIHGDDDRNVDFSQTVRLVEALRDQGVSFEQLVFPDEIHDFLTHAHWTAAYRAAAEFFGRRL